MKIARFFSLFLVLCLLLTACGGAASTDAEFDNGYGMESPAETGAAMDAELKTESGTLSPVADTDRKLIKTVSIRAETEHYDDLITALDSKIAALGGYTENRQTGTAGRDRRYSTMTVRIPAQSLGDFMAHVSDSANVLHTSEQTVDVTLQYSDTEAKITSLKTEQTRLLELLASANNLSEILEIESRLSDVTYELERYESRRRSYDNQITYATVELSIEEVKTLTPVEEPTVWQRICTGFMESLKGAFDGLVDFFVWLIVILPYLAVWIPIIALICFLIGKLRRILQSRKQNRTTDTP
ncbi:MAG: DUF4349 domain-containing protein [Oscillospiraceae bacterium]|nr:DUF4349 domain-containing protein [Oscillospiraceae bacterium]